MVVWDIPVHVYSYGFPYGFHVNIFMDLICMFLCRSIQLLLSDKQQLACTYTYSMVKQSKLVLLLRTEFLMKIVYSLGHTCSLPWATRLLNAVNILI